MKRKIIIWISIIIVLYLGMWLYSTYQITPYSLEPIVLDNGISVSQEWIPFYKQEVDLLKSALWSLVFTGLIEPKRLIAQSQAKLWNWEQSYWFSFENNPNIKLYLHTEWIKKRQWINIWNTSNCKECTPWYMNIEEIMYWYTISTKVSDIAIKESDQIRFIEWTGGNWLSTLQIYPSVAINNNDTLLLKNGIHVTMPILHDEIYLLEQINPSLLSWYMHSGWLALSSNSWVPLEDDIWWYSFIDQKNRSNMLFIRTSVSDTWRIENPFTMTCEWSWCPMSWRLNIFNMIVHDVKPRNITDIIVEQSWQQIIIQWTGWSRLEQVRVWP